MGPDRLGLVPAQPIFHLDDIDRDPRFTHYPFQEGDDLDDDEEEMEVENRSSGGAGDASMAPPSNTHHIYQCLPVTYSFESAQTPGSPWSTHTDTDTTMEMGGLSVAPGGPDLHHVTPRSQHPSGNSKDHVHPRPGRHFCPRSCGRRY